MDDVTRDEYLRLLAEGYELAFEKGELEAGAERYQEALSSLGPGELGYSDHHGELAAVLQKLNRPEQASLELRRALEAARRETPGESDSAVVALAAWSLGEHLLRTGSPQEALEVTEGAATTRSNLAANVLVVRAEAMVSIGRVAEGKRVAQQAEAVATEGQRAGVRERLGALLERT